MLSETKTSNFKCDSPVVGGGFDYLLKLRVADMQGYRVFLGGVLGEMPSVEGTHTYFVMEEVKETTILPLI